MFIPRSGIAWWNFFLDNIVPTMTMISSIYALALLL